MSDIIKLLPDSVANQIAAGEVIQRPASVIKELVENAVDAGAHHIIIIVKDAGRTLIQVVDDGCGMSDTDARMAFERHATSKITSADDLYTLHTMGFRGEALPSIAAVAQIELRTMKQGATIGTRLVINGSKVESQEPEACKAGTSMMVKNLFFNIPVRRKFLKKDSVELSNILREFERLALVNTSVEFTIIHNDVTLHHLLPETFKLRISSLFGKAMEKQLIPVETDTTLAKISGYIGLPEHARRRGAYQYLTVNGRNMRHPAFHKAILQCYAQLIPQDRQPHYFLNLTVDPDTIDVNIHPTKNEIKFENEQSIFQILTAAVKESLNSFNAVPAIDFNQDDAPDIPAFRPDASARPTIDIDPTFNPFEHSSSRSAYSSGQTAGGMTHRNTSLNNWERLYENFNRNSEPSGGVQGENPKLQELLLPDQEPESREQEGTLQIKGRYIVAPSREGMLLIDQHRAHLLVLYNQYVNREFAHQTQQILFPETITLSPSMNAVLISIMDEISSLGFEIENIDECQWSITGVPSTIAGTNPAETLTRMIEAAAEDNEEKETSDTLRSRIALSMARSASINGERRLTAAEREQLMAQLLSLPQPRYTPDGKKVFVTLTIDDLSQIC